jgi:dihydrofolate reductase
MTQNYVYIGTSLDGYIADKNGGLDYLDLIPNPEGNDMGYFNFIGRMDALLMGRNTFEKVLSFGVEWPYEQPVFVLTSTLETIPKELDGKVFLISGSLKEVMAAIASKGHKHLYVDGGKLIQSCLQEDLIDEMIITRIPVLLGGGVPLFGKHEQQLLFKHQSTKVYLDEIVQSHYIRKQ